MGWQSRQVTFSRHEQFELDFGVTADSQFQELRPTAGVNGPKPTFGRQEWCKAALRKVASRLAPQRNPGSHGSGVNSAAD